MENKHHYKKRKLDSDAATETRRLKRRTDVPDPNGNTSDAIHAVEAEDISRRAGERDMQEEMQLLVSRVVLRDGYFS